MPRHKYSMPVLLDRAVNTRADDRFGHEHYARALRHLIESDVNTPPFSIGLLGGWGTGKSTIKSLYESDLHDDISTTVQGRKRSHRIQTITFNAWRYGGYDTDIKRALLRYVYCELGGNEQTLFDFLSNEMQRSFKEARSRRDIARDIWEICINIIPIAAILLLWFISAVLLLPQLSNPWAAALGGLGGPAVVLAFASKYFSDPRRFFIRRYAPGTRVELPRSSAEDYERLLIDQLRAYKDGRGKHCERLVIFVDDLDRLSAEEMVSGLDAIRTFMEMPQEAMPEGMGVVFVISCDEKRVASALANRQAIMTSSEIPGAIRSLSDARHFLDRIFQFRLEVPPFPKQDMRQYIYDQLTQHMPGLAHDLNERGAQIELIIERMNHAGVDSPRKALQILNAFAHSWWLASIREHEGPASDAAGGLREGSVTNHPVSLAALCALRVDFPDFYENLQRDPTLIQRFTDVFLRGHKLEQQPEDARHVLMGYCDEQKLNNGASVALDSKHRPLRQFLANLQGHRWPGSLEPLLLLTQDRISRSYSDGARGLWNALVSADTEGVLEAFGCHLDNRQLTYENVQILTDMLEDTRRETLTRQDNAAFVAANVADRVNENHAPLLVNPLCARLTDSVELRARVGLEGIQKVLSNAHPDHRRHVCGTVIWDLLRLEGDVTLQLPDGQTPMLDKAQEMADQACRLALDVYSTDGLPHAAEKQLIEWLQVRRVQVNGKEEVLPFPTFEGWMDDYQKVLLDSLGSRYAELVLGELENERLRENDLSPALARAKIVLSRLAEGGQEDQRTLWNQLTRLVAIREEEGVLLANMLAAANIDYASDEKASGYIGALAQRLRKSITDEGWEIDHAHHVATLLDCTSKRTTSITTDDAEHLANLAATYIEDEDTAAEGIEILNILDTIDPEQRGRAVEQILPRLLSDTPEKTVRWMGEHYLSSLSDSEQQVLLKHIDSETTTQAPGEEKAQRYRWFIESLPTSAVEQKLMRDHIKRVFTLLQQQHNNGNVIDQLVPAVAPVLQSDVPPDIGQQLQGIVTGSQGNIDIAGRVHKYLADYWPLQSDKLKGYDPSQIFNGIVSQAKQQPAHNRVPDILHSATNMANKGIAGTGQDKSQLTELAMKVWPHNREAALDAIRRVREVPQVDSIVASLDPVKTTDEDDYHHLCELWRIFAHEQETEGLKQCAKKLAQLERKEGPGEVNNDPDAGLTAWIDAMPNEVILEVLREGCVDTELPEETRLRFWAQAKKRNERLGCDWMLKTISEIYTTDDARELENDIIASAKEISNLCEPDLRQELLRTILTSLISTSSLQNKRKLAKWLADSEGQGVLKDLPSMETSDDDVSVLSEYFPANKNVKKLKKEQESTQKDQ